MLIVFCQCSQIPVLLLDTSIAAGTTAGAYAHGSRGYPPGQSQSRHRQGGHVSIFAETVNRDLLLYDRFRAAQLPGHTFTGLGPDIT